MENEIVKYYTLRNYSIEQLSKEFKIGKLKIKKILVDNNIPIKLKGGQIKYISIEFKEKIINKILSCKKCGKELNDIENISGGATSHLMKCSPNVNIPTKIFRSNYKKTKGTYWYLNYFNLIDKPNSEIMKCPDCNWISLDLTNKTGAFTKHITKTHGTIEDFINKHKDYKKYFNNHNKQIERKNNIHEDGIYCKICEEKLKYVNNKHLSKHNITLREYKIKYMGINFISNSTIQKLKDSYDENLKYHENTYKSKPENEITNLIKSYGFDVLNNNKTLLNGVEMDIYVPELKLAIEYNGIYYHTEKMGKDKWYHLKKQEVAKSFGIKLIHIFEDEWVYKKDICINKLTHLIGKNNNEIIFARKTNIKNINKEDAELFLNNNHIQGSSPQSTINIGAYYNGILIGVMSFLKQKNIWILNRFATDINYRCVGLSSKIFNFFIKQYNEPIVVSYADRRWTTDSMNNVYIKMGFKLVSINNPDYKYVNGKIDRYGRIHKFNFRKKKLLKIYPDILNNSMSENEMTEIINCDKIWDCGLFKYQYK